MKRSLIVFLPVLLIGLFISYSVGTKQALKTNEEYRNEIETETLENNPALRINKLEEGLFNCPYSIDGGIYKDYVRTQNEVKVMGKPQLIDNPQVIKLKKPFNKQEFEADVFTFNKQADKGWWSREFDVDGDGKTETIISGNVAMTHAPHIAMVVKNGNIIFEAGGANIIIDPVSGSQGFLLNETVDWNVGEEKHTRYIYKDGGFMPVWTQKLCWVEFE